VLEYILAYVGHKLCNARQQTGGSVKVGDLIGIGWNGKQPYVAVIKKVFGGFGGYMVYVIATEKHTYISGHGIKEVPQ